MTPVRPATAADASEIVRLGGLMYESLNRVLDDEWTTRSERDIERRLDSDLWGWVIDGEDGLAACALLNRIPHLCPPGEEASWRGYVQWVSTDPHYRRRGYAAALMETILEWATVQGAKVVELHATEVGKPLYERLGFFMQTGSPMRLDLRTRGKG
jgi:GNAT superfamily N-acetyltransferase